MSGLNLLLWARLRDSSEVVGWCSFYRTTLLAFGTDFRDGYMARKLALSGFFPSTAFRILSFCVLWLLLLCRLPSPCVVIPGYCFRCEMLRPLWSWWYGGAWYVLDCCGGSLFGRWIDDSFFVELVCRRCQTNSIGFSSGCSKVGKSMSLCCTLVPVPSDASQRSGVLSDFRCFVVAAWPLQDNRPSTWLLCFTLFLVDFSKHSRRMHWMMWLSSMEWLVFGVCCGWSCFCERNNVFGDRSNALHWLKELRLIDGVLVQSGFFPSVH